MMTGNSLWITLIKMINNIMNTQHTLIEENK